MSVKIRAKNASSALQTLSCDNSGHMLVRNSTAEGKLDLIETTNNAIQSAVEGTLAVADSAGNTLLTTIAGDTTSLDAKIPAVGQNAKTASVSVTIASDQGDIAVADSTGNGHLANIVTATQLIDDIVITDNTAYSSASTKGVMLLAKDNSGNMKPVELNSSSELKVTTASSGAETFEVHTSTHSSTSAGASVTSSVETLTKRDCEVGFFVKATNNQTPQSVKIEVSPDNSDFVELSAGGGFNFQSSGSNVLGATSVKIAYPFVRVSLTNDSGGASDITIKITH
jgi:hypothetical protein